MKFAKRIRDVKESATLAITAMAKKLEDVVNFGAGEPDFDTPKYIKEAAIKAINQGRTKYTPVAGIPELKKAISKKLEKDNNLSYDINQIVVSCGAKHSLYNIFQVICEQGDEVIIPSPYWLSYPEMVRLASGVPKILKTFQDKGFRITPKILSKAIGKKTRALILNSPNNPTGVVYNKEELNALSQVIIDKNILVISDEIYEKIIFDAKHFSIASFSDEIKQRTIIVNGVSKSHSMTGWRIGYAAGPKDIIEAISRIMSHSTSNPASISQYAALAALENQDDFTQKMNEEFKKRRDYICERIGKIGPITCVKPQGAFYVFCDISKLKLSSIEFAKKLLEGQRVAVVPGIEFGHDSHIRLSFATSMENIKNGMDRIEKFVKNG